MNATNGNSAGPWRGIDLAVTAIYWNKTLKPKAASGGNIVAHIYYRASNGIPFCKDSTNPFISPSARSKINGFSLG